MCIYLKLMFLEQFAWCEDVYVGSSPLLLLWGNVHGASILSLIMLLTKSKIIPSGAILFVL